MTTKLTGREALAYMATGKWFEPYNLKPHKMDMTGLLMYYREGVHLSPHDMSSLIRSGITPCPDPTVKVDEYAKKRKGLLEMLGNYPDMSRKLLADHILDFVESEFQRKEQK